MQVGYPPPLKGASEQVEEPFVGEFHRTEQKLAGHEMENLLRNTDSTSITTMFPESGPTYFSPQGTSRTLDHWVGPVGIHHIAAHTEPSLAAAAALVDATE